MTLIVPSLAADDLVQAEVSTLRVRPQVHVRGETVTLADVLLFDDADPRLLAAIGDAPVQAQGGDASMLTITHEQLRSRLRVLGVNMARVMLSGSLRCQVTITRPLPGTATASGRAPLLRSDDEPTNVASKVDTAPDSLPARTLADALRDHAAAELAELGGSVEVQFERAGEEFLELTAPPWQFAVRSRVGETLGLREFAVTLRRDGRTHRTVRIAARVRLIKDVLVAARPLNAGRVVRSDDLISQTRAFDEIGQVGYDEMERIVGQQLKHFVDAGGMLRPADIRAGDLVKRSRPVTVVGDAGGISVQLTGVALDSGGFGDVVRIRLGDTRKDRRELRGVVSGVATVRILEGEL